MKKLKVSNVNFFTALPYRALTSLDFVEYEQHSPFENAQLLNEGAVDAANIPITEYALHGGYASLNFGLGSKKEIQGVMVFANEPLNRLKRIYVDDSSSSGAALLKLLLRQKWDLSPELYRVESGSLLSRIREGAGVLAIGNIALNNRGKFPVEIDLSAEWYALTGLPFVYTIWAARPESVSRGQAAGLDELFHKCTKARGFIAENYCGELELPQQISCDHISEIVTYYVDSECRRGIEEFFRRAAGLNILPAAKYHPAGYNIVNETPVSLPVRPLGRILDDVAEGKRISIIDGVMLAEKANLADLSLAAGALVRNKTDRPRVGITVKCRIDKTGVLQGDFHLAELAFEWGFEAAVLQFEDPDLSCIQCFENVIHSIKTGCELSLEAFSVTQILSLCHSAGVRLVDVLSRLITAGIECIPAGDGELILDSKLGNSLSVSEWMECCRLIRRFGAASVARMRVSPEDSWEERFIHLKRIRFLQEETGVFRHFSLTWNEEGYGGMNTEEKIRTLLLSSIFLDNMRCVQELDFDRDCFEGVFGFSSGLHDLELRVKLEDRAALLECLRSAKLLSGQSEARGSSLPLR